MKRVYCLYRVSTLGQVDKFGNDDIPMQKQACHEFASRQGWQITGEFQELGVSGFKVSAKDRDVVQDIQKAAVEGKFDILLGSVDNKLNVVFLVDFPPLFVSSSLCAFGHTESSLPQLAKNRLKNTSIYLLSTDLSIHVRPYWQT